uniref:Uncharacterized protein n=1 Tax=Anguilla anguilla TaxID=7936 RepID=A0A0E9RBH9_ANGAN
MESTTSAINETPASELFSSSHTHNWASELV